ncbi:MAG: RNA repair domain-containing protein [Halobacteriales archaeon]|nr:RNA repair domain-containing protein [Halobacteriales archaeon]
MTTAREALNELRWSRHRLQDCIIVYRHRGAPGDEREVRGSSVLALRSSFFGLPDGASIPYHRVLRVELDGKMVWERMQPG